MVQPVASASIDVTANITRLQKQLDKADRRLRKMERGSKRTSKVMAAGFKRTTLAVGAFAASMGVAVKAISDAGIKAQGLDRAFRAATGSAKAGAQEFAFVRSEANRLGLDLVTSAEAFAKFAASAQGTSLEGQNVRDVFTAVAEASRVMSLSTEQTQGALTALEQIVSKGKVSAEELRGQLGERLPGAFLIAARSIGKTTAELDEMLRLGQLTAEDLLPKFAEELRKTFGAEVESAADDAQAAYTRFGNAVIELQIAIANSGILALLEKLAKLGTKVAESIPLVMGAFGVGDELQKTEGDIARLSIALRDAQETQQQIVNGKRDWLTALLGPDLDATNAKVERLAGLIADLQAKARGLRGGDGEGGDRAELAEKLRQEAEREREAAARARVEAVRKGLVESERITLESVRRTAEQELAIKQEMEALALEGKRLSDQELIALAEETARAKVTAEFAAEQAAKGELNAAMTPEQEIEQLRALNDEKIAEYQRLKDQQLKIGEDFRKKELRGDKLVESSKRSTFNTLTGLLSQFAGKSKALSLLLLAIDTKKALASNAIATQEAAAKAVAIYGPTPKGYAEVANMYRLGGVRAKLITAAGVASGISAVAGGGGAGGGGGGLAGTSTPFDEPIDEEERRDESRVQIIIQGDVNGFDDFAQSKIIPAIQAAVKDQDVVLIDAESRNAAEIVDAAERNV